MKPGGITARQRRLMILAVGKLTASSLPAEREVVFRRVNDELSRLKLGWSDVFEAGLPHPQAPASASSAHPDLASTVTAPRHLSGDEIPSAVEGAVVVERQSEDEMLVRIVGTSFSYGPLAVLDEASRRMAMTVATVLGRVDHRDDPNGIPVLYGLTSV